MPFKSERQRRYMHWAAKQGKISPKVVREFEEATPEGAKLPEVAKIKKSALSSFSEELIAILESIDGGVLHIH